MTTDSFGYLFAVALVMAVILAFLVMRTKKQE